VIDASVLVVGGGGMGSVIAGRMSDAVERVTVLETDADHARRMRHPGLELDDQGEPRVIALDVRDGADALDDRFDFALVTVKAPRLADALVPLAERDLAETFVSLGNGLVQDRVAELVGVEKTMAGVMEFGATYLGPGKVAHTAHGPFAIGELDGSRSDRLERLATVLRPVNDVEVTTNVRGMVWTKLLLNSTWSGLGTVSGGIYSDVAADPVGRAVAHALWTEGLDVGAAQGLALEALFGVRPEALAVRGPADSAGADEAVDAVMAHAGPAKASMLQDLERGRPTEVDVINGGVVERGREHGVATPLNEAVVALVHAMERGEREPSPAVFEELAAVGAAR
jgi:2-dehydropantoate 2-reductase